MSLSKTYFQGKKHRNPNLLMNSGYQCNTTAMINSTFWQIKPPETMIMTIPENDKTCSFIVTQPAVMSQLIDVSRYRHLIDKGRAKIYIVTNIWNTSTILYVTALVSPGLSLNHSFRK
jgi:hypothetical protein